MCLCIGPSGSGKTLLLRKLQNVNLVDETSTAVPTVGTNLFALYNGNNQIVIREVGGAMAPLWQKYYKDVSKVIYVVDTSNLCQISAAGVLLYAALAHPLLRNARFLLVLSKMDVAYRQMRNEALLMLQIHKLQVELRQSIQVVEASAITGDGREEILKFVLSL